MKIKRIEIIFDEIEPDHSKTAVFEDGKWTFDGSIYGRIIVALS